MGYTNSKKYDGVQLYQKKNKDISYYIRYKDENEKLVRIKIGDKSKGITEPYCKQKRDEILNKIRLGEDIKIKHKKQKIVTLDELAKIYFDDKDLENKTNKKLEGKYNLHLKGIFGDRNINSLNKDDILELRKKLMMDNKSNQTINGIIVLLNAIINYSIKEKGLKFVNPFYAMRKLKTDSNRERFLTIEELKVLKEKVKTDEILFYFVELALCTGGRLETILNIQKKDVNITNKTVTLKDIKNNSTYKGFLNDDFSKHLKEYLNTLEINDYVVGATDTKYATTTLQNKLKPILDRLFNKGLDLRDSKNRVVIHTLRHTFASQLAINGTPIFTIQKLMNHSNINMTLRYAKLSPDSGRDFVNDLYK